MSALDAHLGDYRKLRRCIKSLSCMASERPDIPQRFMGGPGAGAAKPAAAIWQASSSAI
ncbi:MAG: hypothetical protein Q7O12_00945 [Deltaproteobacteria bacterium]|nr:hypothetical protein [Deltaproteobacteria bacterium]